MPGGYYDLQIIEHDEETNSRFWTPVSSIISVISNYSNNEVPKRSRGLSCSNTISQDQRNRVTSNLLCAICIEALISEDGNVYSIPGCNHRFHQECIRRWKTEKATCPFCRGPLPDELGETSVNVDSSEDLDNIMRRIEEIIQEMEGNHGDQILPWKIVLLNILICPLGIFFPPMLLLLLWIVETIFFCIGLVVMPFYLVKIIIAEIDGRICKKIGMILAMLACYPLVVSSGVLLFLVFQILYSIRLSVSFYIGVLKGQRIWTDAYKVIVQGTLGLLKAQAETWLSQPEG
jgi:hypothetical protein